MTTSPHTLTDEQRLMARHALGLPNIRKHSYRNRFHAHHNSPAWIAWAALNDAGLACVDAGATSDMFWLTRTGAEAALEAGESLDLEDFPND